MHFDADHNQANECNTRLNTGQCMHHAASRADEQTLVCHFAAGLIDTTQINKPHCSNRKTHSVSSSGAIDPSAAITSPEGIAALPLPEMNITLLQLQVASNWTDKLICLI